MIIRILALKEQKLEEGTVCRQSLEADRAGRMFVTQESVTVSVTVLVTTEEAMQWMFGDKEDICTPRFPFSWRYRRTFVRR